MRLDRNVQRIQHSSFLVGGGHFRESWLGLHSSVRNSKDVPFAKPVRLRLTCGQQLAQQILPVDGILACLLPLLEFRERNPRNESVLGCQKRHVLPQGISAKQMIHEGDLANDAVIPLRIIDCLDATIHVEAGVEEAEFAGEGHLAQDLHIPNQYPDRCAYAIPARFWRSSYIKSKIVQPVPKITCSAWPAGEAVELLDEQPFRVVDEAGQLLHGGHAIRSSRNAFLLCVNRLPCLGEDVRVFGRGEDTVEVGLAEALADGENVFGGVG
jgi:hypothetical protein